MNWHLYWFRLSTGYCVLCRNTYLRFVLVTSGYKLWTGAHSDDMQIVTLEDATCVPHIYMHVASGFVGNLLCKWIRSAANRNETLSTIWSWAIFVLIQPVAVNLTACVVNVKCIKRPSSWALATSLFSCLLPWYVGKHSSSLPIFAFSVSRMQKKSWRCRRAHARARVCNFRTSWHIFIKFRMNVTTLKIFPTVSWCAVTCY